MVTFSYFTNYAILHSMFFTQSLLIILLITLLCRYIQYRWHYRHMHNLAKKLHGPKPLPLIGNALIFLGNPTEILTRILNILSIWESPAKFMIGPHLVVTISKPEHIKTVLSRTFDKGYFYKFINEYIENGLLTSPVPIWKKHRKILQPTFHQKILDTFVSVFNEHSITTVKSLRKEADGKYFEVHPYIMDCALNSVCENALGIKVNSQSGNTKLIKSLSRQTSIVFERICKFWLHPSFIFNLTPLGREFKECGDYVNNFCMTIIKQRRQEFEKLKDFRTIEENESEFDKYKLKRKPFLQLLLESSDFSDGEILSEVLSFVFGGTDSVSTAISFCLMTLGMYPEHQEKICQEINDIFGDSDRPIIPSDLSKFKYLEMFIKETMRIFTVTPFIARVVDHDIEIDEFTIPKGCTACIPIICTHRDPKIWPNRTHFNPERFLPENCAKRHPYSYIPFSSGARNCIGFNYANMFTKIILVNILREYEINCGRKIEDIRLHAGIVLKPTDGFQIKINKR